MTALRLPTSWRRRLLAAGVGALLAVSTSHADSVGAEEAEARAIFTRWIEAQGGVQRLQRLVSMETDSTIQFGAEAPPLQFHLRGTVNALYRYDYETPAYGRLTQAFDGRIAWQKNAVLGFGLLTAPDHQANLGGADFQAPLHVWKLYDEHKVLPDETVDGRRMRVLGFRAGESPREKWFFDAESGLRTRIEVTGANPGMVEFSDFRKVQGSQEPFRVKRTFGGRTVELIHRTLRFNDEVDLELFAAPTGLVEDNQRIEVILWRNSEAGGGTALAGVKSRVTKRMVEVTTSGMKIPTVTFQKQPNLIVQEQDVPGMGKSYRGFDGKTGWAWSEIGGYRVLQGAELQELMAGADLLGPLRLSAQCPFRKLLEEHEDNGRRIIGLALSTMQGPAGNFHFDTDTGHLVRMESFVTAGANGQLKVMADFSDFRAVDGVMLPYVTVITNPAMRIVSTILSVRHNEPLDDAIFRPKTDE